MSSPCTFDGYSPHQAVLGRSSSILQKLSSEVTVSEDAISIQRLREIAVSSIAEATARERINRANRHPSAPTITDESYKHGDLCLPTEGVVVCKWQGRVLQQRAQEIRPHVTYAVFDLCFMSLGDAWSMLRTFVSRLPHPSIISVRYYQDVNRSWQPTSQSSTP
eukprot:917433-Amphidinium_carterae.4